MGQQQLLLLVLASIIVGFMTLSRVQATKEVHRRQMQEALRERAFEIGNAATSSFRKGKAAFNPGKEIPASSAGSKATCVIQNLSGGKGGLPENSNGQGKAKGRKKRASSATVSCDQNIDKPLNQSVKVKVSLKEGRRVLSINGNSISE